MSSFLCKGLESEFKIQKILKQFLILVCTLRNLSLLTRGTVTTILLLSRQNCCEIMTQNLYSKTRNTSATTRGRYQEILQGRANQGFFFLEIFLTRNNKT